MWCFWLPNYRYQSLCGIFNHQTTSIDWRWGVSCLQTIDTSCQSRVSKHCTTSTNCGAKSLATRPLAPITKQSHRTSDWRHRCQGKVSSHWTSDLTTKWVRGSLCVFWKCLTKFSKVKHFSTFYKWFYGQQKIFYMLDYIYIYIYIFFFFWGECLTIFYLQTNTWKWQNILLKIFYFKTYRVLKLKFHFGPYI